MKTSSSENSLLIRQFIGALLAFGFVGYILINAIFFSKEDTYLDCLRDETDTRNVTDSTIQLTPLWGMHINVSNFSQVGSQIVIQDNLLISSNIGCKDLDAYGLKTGVLAWYKNGIQTNSLWADSANNRVYTVYSRSLSRQGDHMSRFRAINTLSGRQIWQNDSLKSKSGGKRVEMDPNGNLYAYAGTEYIEDVYVVNQENGVLEERIEVSDNILFYSENLYLEHARATIFAYTIDTHMSKWVWQDGDWSRHVESVQVKDGVLLVDSYEGVVVLEYATGKPLWKSSSGPSASNVWVDNGIVYFLDYQARLVMLELQTGKVVGIIKFERPKESNLLAGSYVTASENVVAIYFQDTRKLSVFEWSASD